MAKKQTPSLYTLLTASSAQLTNKIIYIVLLVSFLIIGYLFGQLQAQGGSSLSNNQGTNPSTLPQAGDPAAPIFAEVDNGKLPVKGNENAPVTIVEFSDFECPFCAQFFRDSLPQIIEEYVDKGIAKIYYRHLPLDFHPKARTAALASECANEQGAFWQYHDTLFENQSQFSTATTDTFVGWATSLGLNGDQFRTCLETEKFAENVDNDVAAATAAGASGTPTFYINGQQLVGAQPFASFQAIIDQELEN